MEIIWDKDSVVEKILHKQTLCSDTIYKWSQYVIPFEEEGCSYLFHALTRQCVISSRTPSDDYISGEDVKTDDELCQLASNWFLVKRDEDECRLYESIYRMIRAYCRRKGIKAYTILPTMACNARCVYCYEEGRGQSTMTPETVDRLVEYIDRTRKKDTVVRLSWFGGEPLLCESIIDSVCEQLNGRGIPYYSSMISNGSLMTEPLAEKMASLWNIRFIQISMDAGEEEYIRRKNYYKYRDYYHSVPESIRFLTERGIRVNIRCNIDHQNVDDIPAFMQFMSKAIKDKRLVGIYFAMLNDERVTDGIQDVWDKIFQAENTVESYGFRFATNVNAPKFKTNRCMADNTNESVVITPDGLLYPCEHCDPGTSFGNIFAGITSPDVLREYERQEQVLGKCRTCAVLPECTTFSKCPIKDANCYPVRHFALVRTLKYLIRKKTQTGENAETLLRQNC